jgi:hypothetical protein
MAVHVNYPSFKGSINQKTTVQASLEIKAKPYQKNNKEKKKSQGVWFKC